MLLDHLQKNKQRTQKFKETGDSWYIYQKELDKACFQQDMANGLASMVYIFFDKKTSGIKNENMWDQQLVQELHKPIIKKFKERKVHSPFIDNI